MEKAKSPATPNILDIPSCFSLDRTCSITVGDAAFSVGADAFDIIDLPFMLRLRSTLRPIVIPFMWIFASERQVRSWLALISRGRPPMLLRATIHSQLLARCAPSKAG